MGSGAYSVFIDPPAGGGQSAVGQRVVPLPPAGFGSVPFTDVYLSICYDDFDPSATSASTVRTKVRILGANSALLLEEKFDIPRGRSLVAVITPTGPLAGALAASITTDPVGPPGHQKLAAVTALVEYSIP